jgi:peroxiredoxin (alkyl hydroperoxide reductase subunit C)
VGGFFSPTLPISHRLCTTEFMTIASMQEEFKALDTELTGFLSTPLWPYRLVAQDQELEWKNLKGLSRVTFPLDRGHHRWTLPTNFGMNPAGPVEYPGGYVPFSCSIPKGYHQDDPCTTRSRPDGTYDEIKRIILALQKADASKVATPPTGAGTGCDRPHRRLLRNRERTDGEQERRHLLP